MNTTTATATATVVHHHFGSGAASVERIAHGMRTGAIKTNPRPALRRASITPDPLLLRDGIPVLRLVGSKLERRAPEPVPFVAAPLPAAQRSEVDTALRARVWTLLALWCAGWVVGLPLYFLLG